MIFCTRSRSAFSLVELSIVLVILGLLVGGVLAGKSLVHASELRAVISESQRYLGAFNTFRDKYFALPGDMSNATSFWGTDPDGCPGTNAAITYSAATCNGDANNVIVLGNNELYRAWQHLSNAGLIEGSYSGVPDNSSASTLYPKIGTNSPASKMTNNGWSFYPLSDRAISNTWAFEGSYGSAMIFGTAVTNSVTDGAGIIPEDAWNIDSKLDDGKPGTGKVRTFESLTTCHDAGTSAVAAIGSTANYALSTTSIACSLIFNTGV